MKKASVFKRRGGKTTTIKFRIDPRQKKFWEEQITALGVEDISAYIRNAVDRSIGLDFRSADPKWQAFLAAIQKQAKHYLGYGLMDNAKERLEVMKAVEAAKTKEEQKPWFEG